MGNRSRARAAVVEALYQLEFHQDGDDSLLLERSSDFTDDSKAFYAGLLHGVSLHLKDLDQDIERFLKEGWALDRIAVVDKAILRLATYELRFCDDTPANVVINEAVELAKSYGNEESSRFINGILGSMTRSE